MTPDQFILLMNTVNETVKTSVKETVNGKIDRMNQKLDDYITSDNEWKATAQPVIDLGNNTRNTSKALLWVAGAIVIIGGAVEIIIKLFKK